MAIHKVIEVDVQFFSDQSVEFCGKIQHEGILHRRIFGKQMGTAVFRIDRRLITFFQLMAAPVKNCAIQ